MTPATQGLTGRVVVVTGASRGLGRTMARTLNAAGATVVALARPSAELDSLPAETGPDTRIVPCDLADPAAVRDAIRQVGEAYGRIDCLVHNAAVASLLKVEEATAADIEREFGVNLIGPANVTSAAIPYLRAAGGGDVVFVSSESVHLPFPFMTLYVASKAGLEGFARGLRNELRPDGTRVSILRVGGMESGTISREWDAERMAQFISESTAGGYFHYTGKLFRTESVAQTLLSLLTLPRDVNLDLVEARAAAGI